MIKGKKRGQFQLSYGMIFSIILIVCFIVVAFIAINFFLKMGCSSDEVNLIKNFQDKVDEIWSGGGIEGYTFREIIGENCGIKEICFYNSGKDYTTSEVDYMFMTKTDSSGKEHNFYLYPQRKAKIPSVYIKHINIENLAKNPYCIKIEEGKIEIKLNKGIRESLVNIG